MSNDKFISLFRRKINVLDQQSRDIYSIIHHNDGASSPPFNRTTNFMFAKSGTLVYNVKNPLST